MAVSDDRPTVTIDVYRAGRCPTSTVTADTAGPGLGGSGDGEVGREEGRGQDVSASVREAASQRNAACASISPVSVPPGLRRVETA
jgi:hypothetical protein